MSAQRDIFDEVIAGIRTEAAAWEPGDGDRLLARLRRAAAALPRSAPTAVATRSKGRSWIYVFAGIAVVAAATLVAMWMVAPGPATLIGLRGALLEMNQPLAAGAELPDNTPIRTAVNADAMISLGDGSVVELAGGSTLRLMRNWWGEALHLDRGRVLVEAAKQHFPHRLYVATTDCRVAVKGTIFEVDRTRGGSRVSVVRGRVSVTTSARRQWLTAGGQATSDANVQRLPVGADVAWSRDASVYWALLGYSPPATPPAPSPESAASPAPTRSADVAAAAPAARPVSKQKAVAPPQVASKPLAPQPAVQPAKPAPPIDPIVLLLQQADNAIADVPAEFQPQDWLDLAAAEAIHHPNMARDTVVRAFHAALNLSPPTSDDDALGQWHYVIKQNTELQAMGELVRRGQDWETAHQLARIADVPRGRLYDDLISAAWGYASRRAGDHPPLEQGLLARTFGGLGYKFKPRAKPITGVKPGYDVLTLANECHQADGSFPYLGVIFALQSYRSGGADQEALVLATYNAAAQEKDLLAMNTAVGALMSGHRLYPSFDQQMESAALSLLQHLEQAVQNPPSGGTPAHQQYVRGLAHGDAAAGGRLLSLVAEVDPGRAAQLKAQYPDLYAPPPHLVPIAALTAGQRQDNADPASALATANAMPNVSDQQKTAKFLALAHLAVVLAKQHPDAAAQAASHALDLMTDDIVKAHPSRVGLLALRMGTDLNEPDQAVALMTKALDAAESVAESKEQAYDNVSDPNSRRSLSDDFNGAGAPEVDVFAYAALLDPDLAVQRAENTTATYFKPLFLMRAAVGEMMQHPWWSPQ